MLIYETGPVNYPPSQVALVVKNPPANAGDIKDVGSIPGLGRSPGEGHGNPLQYSFLENSKDRGAWQTTGSRTVGHDWATEQQLALRASQVAQW